MANRHLTNNFIKNLKVDRQTDHYDSLVRNFGVRATAGGTKSFFVMYRLGKQSKRHTLGRYPALSLAEARKNAQEALALVRGGKDPAALKRAARDNYQDTLFSSVVVKYIEVYAKRQTKAWEETHRLLNREFVPVFKHHQIADIKSNDVSVVLDEIVARGSPSAANHAFAAVRKLFNWACEHEYLSTSPVARLRPPSKHVHRDRVLSGDEIVRIWTAAADMGYPYGHVVQLLLLTGQRRDEVAHLRWTDLDLLNAKWTLPAIRNKSGRQHTVPLTEPMIQLLRSMPTTKELLVFPARGKDTPIAGFSKWKSQLDANSAVYHWRIHDIRRTVASGMAQLHVSPHVIERVLNHKTGILGGVAGIYNQYGYLPEMRTALNLWNDHLISMGQK